MTEQLYRQVERSQGSGGPHTFIAYEPAAITPEHEHIWSTEVEDGKPRYLKFIQNSLGQTLDFGLPPNRIFCAARVWPPCEAKP